MSGIGDLILSPEHQRMLAEAALQDRADEMAARAMTIGLLIRAANEQARAGGGRGVQGGAP